MKKSLALTVAFSGLFAATEFSMGGPPLDFPGPGYRRQAELFSPSCEVDDVLRVRTAPPVEEKPTPDLWWLKTPLDSPEPIRLFPEVLPPLAPPLPPSSATLK
jgi:hypothetical protein